MKSFLDKIFKPYIFPIIIVVIGAYLKIGQNFNSVVEFFSDTSSSFLNSFNYQFYVWEILLYLISSYIVLYIIKLIRNGKGHSKETKKLLKLIRNSPNKINITETGSDNKYFFSFKADVKDEEIKIEKLQAYCLNCRDEKLKMAEKYYGGFECNCGRNFDYNFSRDIRNLIISKIESGTLKY
ncbi:hypothetical protein [Maribacter sp. 1_MG-2023]|uniref:hypothetical protein n=1 Tax=Maribacter sp. 1_MG-2023 TaxID=3062677 RepID=UPI0026E25CDC|nr:hypothetical protein [Maribacter sp. 1_MG-2023]MDO6473727.1 hypothetical protein [Maribacter sp. 1_MG-2023]